MIVTERKIRSKEYVTGQLCTLEPVSIIDHRTKLYVIDDNKNIHRIITKTMNPSIFKK